MVVVVRSGATKHNKQLAPNGAHCLMTISHREQARLCLDFKQPPARPPVFASLTLRVGGGGGGGGGRLVLPASFLPALISGHLRTA